MNFQRFFWCWFFSNLNLWKGIYVKDFLIKLCGDACRSILWVFFFPFLLVLVQEPPLFSQPHHWTIFFLESHQKAMEKLVSSWYNVQSLPENYIFPPETRPGKEIVPICNKIPVVDLEGTDATWKILKAIQEFGFFQVFLSFSLLLFHETLFIMVIYPSCRWLTMEFQRD